MKLRKNLYWIMIPLYVLIIVMVLLLNGVLTGEMGSGANIAINIVFMIIVAALIVSSTKGLSEMSRAAEELEAFSKRAKRDYESEGIEQWDSYAKVENVFDNDVLKRQFAKYQRLMNNNERRAAADISDFINDEVLESIGQKQFNSALSGIFTGLGILGTFIGLSFGLISFSGNDIFTISDNVGPLLEGMKVAFHTSVYGMLLSIVFSLVYRELMAYVYETVAEFTDIFRECVAPASIEDSDMSSALYSLGEDILAEMSHISELLEARAASEDAAMRAMAERFADSLTVSVGNSLKQVGNAMAGTQRTYERN